MTKSSAGLPNTWAKTLGMTVAGMAVTAVAGFLAGTGCRQAPPEEAARTTAESGFPDSVGPQRPMGGGRFLPLPEHRRKQRGEELEKEMKRLRSLGYAGGSESAPQHDGVTVYDPEADTGGVNLLCDGHGAWAGLIDMAGRELHSWSFPFGKAFPEADTDAQGTGYYRRVALDEDGSLLAIFEGLGLIKVDRDSRLLWRYSGRAHHDLEIQDDGRIFVLTREAELLRRVHRRKPVLHDFVVVLDSSGQELERVSILEALESSPYASLIEISAKQGDLFHTNTVEVLDGRFAERHASLRRGNVLLSLREVNTVVILDMERRQVVWSMAGLFKAQHQPTLLDNGHLLVFDNRGLGHRSRVLEVDPITRDVVWTYDDPDFYSRTCGSSQRLPNGNTLITESDAGRAFEVTPEGRIVWEYVSPHRFGHQGRKIATVFELVRLRSDFPLDWMR